MEIMRIDSNVTGFIKNYGECHITSEKQNLRLLIFQINKQKKKNNKKI